MKIAIVTNFFYEGQFGGTEKYCYELIKAYQRKNIEAVWVMPNFDTDVTLTGTTADSIDYIYFAAMDLETKDPKFVGDSFVATLKEHQVSVVHFHEFGGPEGSNPALVKIAKQNNFKCFVTYHLISYTCTATDLRYLQTERCNGYIDVTRCTRCLISHKLPGYLSFFSKYPLLIPPQLLKQFSRVSTSIAGRIAQLQTVATYANSIISLTDWFKDVLMVNGVPSSKISVIKQAYSSNHILPNTPAREERIAYCYLGRITPSKGVYDVIEAFRQRGMGNVQLDLYGPDYSLGLLSKLIANDKNINYKGTVAHDDVTMVISKYKALIVPSVIAEMASLTIVEAYLADTPVIVSDVPGNVEMANNYGNSLVFPTGDHAALAEMIIAIQNGELDFTEKKPMERNDFDTIAESHLKVYNQS